MDPSLAMVEEARFNDDVDHNHVHYPANYDGMNDDDDDDDDDDDAGVKKCP